jgi:hypothetical protein
MGERLMRQKEAAAMLDVSVSYLRASDCPKVLLPSSSGKRSLVRYRESELLAWLGFRNGDAYVVNAYMSGNARILAHRIRDDLSCEVHEVFASDGVCAITR